MGEDLVPADWIVLGFIVLVILAGLGTLAVLVVKAIRDFPR